MKFLCVFFVLVLLGACSDDDTPNVCPPAFETIDAPQNKTENLCNFSLAVFIDNQKDSQGSRLSRDALVVYSSYREYIDTQQPITVFLFENKGLNAYLGEQRINQNTFLTQPRLEDFIAATMISEISVLEAADTHQTFELQTLSGDSIQVSNRRPSINGQVLFDMNGQEVTCIERRFVFPNDGSHSVCLTSRPFVAFDW